MMGIQSLSFAGETTVLVFIIDGLQSDAAKVAASNGAENLKFLMENGVWVEEAYCTSPATRGNLVDQCSTERSSCGSKYHQSQRRDAPDHVSSGT